VGEAGSRAGIRVQEGEPQPTRVSSELMRVSSEILNVVYCSYQPILLLLVISFAVFLKK
jgi:hypothetical protein